MKILGISCFYHDSAATLIIDGKIIAAAQEERFTRKKHDPSFPSQAIKYCLAEGNITPSELDGVVFYDKPFLKFERLLETHLSYAPRGLRTFLKAMPVWLKEKLWMEDLIRKKITGYPDDKKIFFVPHHESHAASAFFPSPFKEAAILTIDGVGEWASMSIGIGRDNKIKLLKELDYPHSLGLLYSAFTYFTGFKVNSGEYKLMGLAPYGQPKYKDIILEKIVDLKEDGSFRLDLSYFDFPVGSKMTNDKFANLFGGPERSPESKITQREMDLAASIQAVTEEIIGRLILFVKKETGAENLCLAGGVALNCVANSKILNSNVFKNIWVQPAAGDAGGSLGAALALYHNYYNKERILTDGRDKQEGSYLGIKYSQQFIEGWLKENNIKHKEMADDQLLPLVASLIADDKVVGWFSGRMEFGPRALGSRSILGDARSASMQSTMNLKIKFRESFRPFAPSVLADKASEWFDIEPGVESPYMLLTAQVKENKLTTLPDKNEKLEGLDKLKVVRSQIPAVTHVDNSARLQTVNHIDNPRYYRLISEFDKLTGCPVIINTSFNVRGEPIVASPQDAYKCFMRTNMDYLVLENYLIDKKDQPKVEISDKWQDQYPLD